MNYVAERLKAKEKVVNKKGGWSDIENAIIRYSMALKENKKSD